MNMDKHEKYMRACLYLAEKGMGSVSPNPMVGSVIVYDGKVIGRGYHASYGGPHAEVNAIDSVKEEDRELLKHSTLYVNLEPCAHFGKTPPCAELIVRMGIPHVVYGSEDPNPLVAGQGVEKLRNAGVEVLSGVLKKEADFLNRRFFTAMTKHRPYIILKWAESQDGFMAGNGAKQIWLTGEESKKRVHEWRAEEDAIMVGTRTVEIDNPELTVRLVEGKNPMRVVIDQNLTLDPSQKIFNNDVPVFVYNEKEESISENIHRIKINFAENILPQIMNDLYLRKVRSLIVEGGADTLQHFVETDLWDEARIFSTEKILGEGKKGPKVFGKKIGEEKIGNDTLITVVRE